MTDDAKARPMAAGHPLLDLPDIDVRAPNVARVWNYLVGGKDNFESDRAASRELIATAPVMAVVAPVSRAFLRRVVRWLVTGAGIRQFLDIGTGLPTAGNTHDIAQAAAPDCRVVYVDNDPVVLAHARALLTSTPEGVTSYLDADAREPDQIIAGAAGTLDFGRPVAIICVDVLNFIEEDEVVGSALAALTGAVAPGSYLAVMHPASDLDPALPVAARRWNAVAKQPIRLRTREQVAAFSAGLDLVEPGLVTVPEWHPAPDDPAAGTVIPLYAFVARKSRISSSATLMLSTEFAYENRR